MLEHHAHALTQGIDVQFYGLSIFIPIFLLGDIHTAKNDGTTGRLLQQVQTAQEGRLSGTGWSDDSHHIPFVDVDRHAIQGSDGAHLIMLL